MKKNILFQRAVRLRQNGASLLKIATDIGVAKSTAYDWLRGIAVSKSGVVRLQRAKDKGREKGLRIRRDKIKERDAAILDGVKGTLMRVRLDVSLMKLLAALLYWSEGEKGRGRLAFTNSDPSMVRFFLKMLRKGFHINEAKLRAVLHLHSYHDITKQQKFWSKVTRILITKISIHQKRNSGKNVRTGYPGCISIRYNDVVLYSELGQLYTRFADSMGE